MQALLANGTLSAFGGAAPNATNATGGKTDPVQELVDRVVMALDPRRPLDAPRDVIVFALSLTVVLLPLILIVLLYCCCCCPKITCFYWYDCWCRWLCGCCRRPLSGQEELDRGPDQAIEEHQDYEADVDSIDEPVRRTPPGTDGEEEDDDDAAPPSPNRACCSAMADALESNEDAEAPAPSAAAPGPAPDPPPSAKKMSKRTVFKSVACSRSPGR